MGTAVAATVGDGAGVRRPWARKTWLLTLQDSRTEHRG